jgi:hypothetical protein
VTAARGAEASNPKFAFLQPEHPNHAYSPPPPLPLNKFPSIDPCPRNCLKIPLTLPIVALVAHVG